MEETHFAWEQKLRLSFSRLRVVSKAESSESLPLGNESKDASLPQQHALSLSLQVGQATAQPHASEVDPLPAIAHELLEVLINSPQGSGSVDLTGSPKSAVSPPPSTQSGKALAPAMSAVDFRITERSGVSGIVWMRMKVKMYIDYVAGILVLLNTLLMLVELELEGRHTGHRLGMAGGLAFEEAEPVFRFLDALFVYIYLVELFVRVWITWPDFHRSFANWFDTLLVLSGLVDVYIIVPLAQGQSGGLRNIAMLRLFRAAKSLRSMRMVRTFRLFQGLRLLVQACTSFLPSLGWSMVLLGVFMMMGALIMGNLLQDWIMDASIEFEDRRWLWLHYGTSWQSLYTLYEITFAGNWPTRARPVVEKVSAYFAIFYVCYITIIVFAVIRVISAIFLKDTLDAAHSDADNLVAENLAKKAEYVKKLESFFKAIDEFGDGLITEERLTDILSNPKVAAYFATLDVDVHESAALFHLLDDGDGQVTLEEFIDGICRCKGPARAIDQVAMHSDIKQLDKKVSKLVRVMRDCKLIDSSKRASKSAGLKSQQSANRAQDLMIFRMKSLEGETSFSRHQSPW